MTPKKTPEDSETKPTANYPQIRVKLVRSLLGHPGKHCRVARALGLKKTNDIVTHYDSPTIRGMVQTIIHLLNVEVA